MNLNEPDAVYKIALTMIPGLGGAGIRKILAQMKTERNIFENPEETKKILEGFSKKVAESFKPQNYTAKAAEQLEILNKYKIKAVYYTDNDFPQKLSTCDDSPIMLYMRGNVNLQTSHTVGIVGTRSADGECRDNIFKLIEDLKTDNINVIIVSGLAAGADTFAHQAALKYKIPTAAVLGHGFNTIYPAANRTLAAQIANGGGVLITEFYYGHSVSKTNFPRRNRIVAGICDALVVAQSREKGGALITAAQSLEYHRNVFAFPGRANDKNYAGCNQLIRDQKAGLITSAQDLTMLMGWSVSKKTTSQQSEIPLFSLSEQESKIVNFISQNTPAFIDSIASATNISMAELSSMLLSLEFSGIIKPLPGKYYEIR